MVSSVKWRRNHYETLGLQHTATDEEIAAAFAVESRKIIQNPRVNEPDVREKARQVRTAHQTLRDPAKRSAYDASLGLVIVPPVQSSEAQAEPSARPFVAATPPNAAEPKARGLESLLRPKDGPVPPGDQHISHAPADAVKGRTARRGAARRPQEVRSSRAKARSAEDVIVVPLASRSRAEPGQKPSHDRPSRGEPEQAGPPRPRETPFVAPIPVGEAKAEATQASAIHSPPPEPLHDSASKPEPVHVASTFDDSGMGTRRMYGERRGIRLSRSAVTAMAALVVALAIAALFMWPSGSSVDGVPNGRSGRAMAGADASPTPPNALGGLPSGETGADPQNPSAAPELADAGSYESLTFAEAGPVPPFSSSTVVTEAPAGAVAGGAIESTSVPGEQRAETVASTSPAPAAPNAATAQAAPVASSTQVAVNAPVRTQPAPDLRPVTPAKLVSGSLLNSDNRRGAFQGTVSVRFAVSADGRATGCRPTSGSGNARLDTYTCQLVQERLRFSPALSAQGKPVASQVGATYTWGRKRRSLTSRILGTSR